jgi:hypothetical protein
MKDMMNCAALCVETEMNCLDTCEKMDASMMMMMRDCAEMNRLACDSMTRGSACSGLMISAAADVCKRLAEDCSRFTGDEDMQKLADACRKCASAAQKIAKA